MIDAAKFWDGIAPKYAQSPIKDMEAYEYSLERTKSYLSRDDQVLELGCGTGSTALLLAPHLGHLTASDLSEKMVEIGREKAVAQGVANVDFVASDIYRPAFEEKPYDAVLAHNLLHLLEDLDGALARISAWVKPGGYFISKTVCKTPDRLPLKLWLMMTMLPVAQFFGKAPFVNMPDIADLERKITAAGFKIIETGNYPASPPPSRYIVAQKM